jgi:hypothetical protein
MRKMAVLALVTVVSLAADARAVEFKNVRATFGPFGAIRPDNKLLPGDVYTLNFDVAGLVVDPKTGAAKYTIKMEVFDPKGKQTLDDKDSTAKKGVMIGFGGNAAPEAVRVVLGVDKPVGKYKVVVTITDPANNSTKQLSHEVELQPQTFCILHVLAPAVGLTGQGFTGPEYALSFSLAGMTRDAKKMPKITVVGRVLDEAGKPTTTEPMITYKIPEELPAEMISDLPNRELIPLVSPMLLNRPGRFTVQIEARDELSKKTAKFSYSFTVLDPVSK